MKKVKIIISINLSLDSSESLNFLCDNNDAVLTVLASFGGLFYLSLSFPQMYACYSHMDMDPLSPALRIPTLRLAISGHLNSSCQGT